MRFHALNAVLMAVLASAVLPHAAGAAGFELTVNTSTSSSASAHGKTATSDQGSLSSKATSQGEEASQCKPYGRPSSASSSARADKKLDATSATLSMYSFANSKGGHYRTCTACAANECLFISPNDTRSSAHGLATSSVMIRFSNDVLPGKYKIGVAETFTDKGATRLIELKDASGKAVPLTDRMATVDVKPGDTYTLAAILDASAANEGECCQEEKEGALTLQVWVDRLPELSYETPFILGGYFAKGYPQVGLLAIRGVDGTIGPHCTATVVGARTVLTAAHCVADDYYTAVKEHRFRFILGSSMDDPNAKTEEVVDADFPKEEKAGGFRYQKIRSGDNVTTQDDIALVFLKSPVSVKPIERGPVDSAAFGDLLSSHEPITFVGFGFYSIEAGTGAGDGAGKKRQAQIPISELTARTFGYAASKEGQSTCQGDSGGPALLETPPAGWRVVGVTAYGFDKCTGGHSMRVDAFEPWIKDRIKN